jgi:hypothetical protein
MRLLDSLDRQLNILSLRTVFVDNKALVNALEVVFPGGYNVGTSTNIF